jgi:hypothetical protein
MRQNRHYRSPASTLAPSWNALKCEILAGLFLMMAASVACGQLTALPTGPGKFVGHVRSAEPGGWLVLGAGFLPINPVISEDTKSVAFEAPAGEYGVFFFKAGSVQPQITRVVLGGGTPGPNPPEPPEPTPGGPYQILFYYQGEDLDNLPQAQRDLMVSLAVKERLKAAGHVVLGALEAQSMKSGSVPARWKAWVDAVQGDPLPRVAIAPKAGGPVHDFPLPVNEAALNALLANPKGAR